jgi:N-dimethylarginine dimethylaminohydrolase
MTSEKDRTDILFTANLGFVLGDNVIPSRFSKNAEEKTSTSKNSSRKMVSPSTEYPSIFPLKGHSFHGFRAELNLYSDIAEWLKTEVFSLHLIDDRFYYYLDTCFCPLSGG